MSKTRIKISSASIEETEIFPIWSGEFSWSIVRERVYYAHELKGDPVLRGDDFTLINDLENPCEKILLIVERYCGEDWVEYWRGSFTKFDTNRDFGGIKVPQCVLQAKIKPENAYTCLFEEWEDEVNFFSASAVIPTRSMAGTYQLLGPCKFCSSNPDPDPCDDLGVSGEACLEYSNINFSTECPPGQYQVVISYHRTIGVGTPTEPPPYDTGWTYLSGNNWWKCPEDDKVSIGVLGNGRRFDDTLEYLLLQTGCGLTLRSHFFGINATHDDPPDNVAYDHALVSYRDITIHQKSDVKRPASANPSLSQVWKMKLKDVLTDLQTMFNVFFKIEGSDLILEHISYFGESAGADYTDKPMKLSLEYEAETPKREFFKWSDPDVSPGFAGFPITYDCGNGDKEHRVQLFTTDVLFVNNIINQDKVSDDNFVLICNKVVGGQYVIIDLNDPLSWVTLHNRLHKYYRPFISGTMNQEATTFLSTQKIQKQPEFTVGLCCDEAFDPTQYITTQLGQGRIKEAIENIKKDTLQLQLNYE